MALDWIKKQAFYFLLDLAGGVYFSLIFFFGHFFSCPTNALMKGKFRTLLLRQYPLLLAIKSCVKCNIKPITVIIEQKVLKLNYCPVQGTF